MLHMYFDAGGPVMYAVFATWVIVLAVVLDRLLYLAGYATRQPRRHILAACAADQRASARTLFNQEQQQAKCGLTRIDAVSQLATSIGLFGTVVGIARSFLSAGQAELGLAAPEVLAAGLSTALFTTIGGLVVFLFGQAFLIGYDEWWIFSTRGLADLLAEDTAT